MAFQPAAPRAAMGAALDTDGLFISQQFFGLWPITQIQQKDLLALSE
jgi:hypothetical protein